VRPALVVVLVLLAAVAALSAVGHLLFARREPLARAPAPSDAATRFLDTRSGRTHLLDVGAGDPVLLLHGSGRSVADWQEGFADALAARDHRVLAIDYYGNGLSDRAHALRYGIALWAEQAVDVLDALGLDRVAVLGHSAGGCVAAILAADHPERVRRAVFVGHGTALDPAQVVPLLPGVGELALARMDLFGTPHSPRHAERLAAGYRIRGTRAALLTFLRRQYTVDGLRLVLGTYEEIQAPVLQVHGGEDASIPVSAARGLSPRLRDSRFVRLDGVGHDVHLEAPETLAAEVGAFLRSAGP